MRLYIDDDSVDPSLIRLLRRDGHDVQIPADVGLAGRSDQVHLAHAIRDQRAILTKNYRDFEALHDLVVCAALCGRHRPRRPQSGEVRRPHCRLVSPVEPLAIVQMRY